MTTIPIKDLKDTGKVSALVDKAEEPVLVTKNGYPKFYLVKADQMDAMELAAIRSELHSRLDRSERQYASGEYSDMRADVEALRKRHGL
ncbi:MAG: type II toxin-antitoxin system Phd/YefM family antitoxin [Atopobiaceae bacterium]|nr:type II toxin-antitoxin system Phd/YefM family antitoxin [Atopobiaceae bacterium]MCI2207538.1 type II toxin-antitoxin system Phd/YefM family antitoxin [Atopobiaceae bacterium]